MKRPRRSAWSLLTVGILGVTVVVAVGLTLVVAAGATTQRSSASSKKGLVAFVGTATSVPQLYVVKPDGSQLRQLTFDSGGIGPYYPFSPSPQWSSDGKRLLATAAPDVIASMRANGSDRVDLQGTSPAFSPNGKWLAYYVCASAFSPSIGDVCDLMVASSHGLKPNLVAAGVSFSGTPGWSSDSQKLAYVKNGSIWQSDRRGRHNNEVVSVGFAKTLVFFPDDHTIAYIAASGFMRSSLFSVPADGGTPTESVRGSESIDLIVSPTRTYIATTTSSVSIGTFLAAYDPSFALLFRLPHSTVSAWRQVWSPDGSKLGYSYCARISTATSPVGYPGSPCTLQFSDTSGTTVFYNGPAIEPSEPWVAGFDWSPDSGSLVLSVSVSGGPFRLMTVKADGSGLKPIFPSGSDNQTHPAWQP